MDHLSGLLTEWKYIKSHRDFRLTNQSVAWFFHISCINHKTDFDAVGDVAVEIRRENNRVCIVGASLSNIEGTGQVRFAVSSPAEAKTAAVGLNEQFHRVGIPFLRRYSDAAEILRVLRAGGSEALLISPLKHLHPDEIRALEEYLHAI
jgi:hypothetical protein